VRARSRYRPDPGWCQPTGKISTPVMAPAATSRLRCGRAGPASLPVGFGLRAGPTPIDCRVWSANRASARARAWSGCLVCEFSALRADPDAGQDPEPASLRGLVRDLPDARPCEPSPAPINISSHLATSVSKARGGVRGVVPSPARCSTLSSRARRRSVLDPSHTSGQQTRGRAWSGSVLCKFSPLRVEPDAGSRRPTTSGQQSRRACGPVPSSARFSTLRVEPDAGSRRLPQRPVSKARGRAWSSSVLLPDARPCEPSPAPIKISTPPTTSGQQGPRACVV
jgi:hypothetical protein